MLYYTLCDFWHFFQSRVLDRLFYDALTFECPVRSSELLLYYHTLSTMSIGFAHFVQKRLKNFVWAFLFYHLNGRKWCFTSVFSGGNRGERPKTYLSEQGSDSRATTRIFDSSTSLCLVISFPSSIWFHLSNMICRSDKRHSRRNNSAESAFVSDL